ncbi:MAG: hypothetical protein DYG83_00160 [Candidatus Brocadia sp. AMX2]|uniref:hypothetical protein n=1 Tax=Candidatus Brocadia TaxID=380240 RepID=UPI000696B242|nr:MULTISPECIES: hypothetical protein [Brocadia]MBC6931766.1 hypothetical protein [Candidatus Brocadia sp.]MBL1167378.1 hypothetical protein [Candidatus Brocadia sp. AMX1]MCK6466749.1 hypothetical protein [Candidatus Brocadia sinica]NOG41148.1 hypothetical protein [Planctomycetota bacterium]KAA0245778.1 MAG: hypothetical protein EDM70_02580 [Candidatus Brocadia sp. AMX2]
MSASAGCGLSIVQVRNRTTGNSPAEAIASNECSWSASELHLACPNDGMGMRKVVGAGLKPAPTRQWYK